MRYQNKNPSHVSMKGSSDGEISQSISLYEFWVTVFLITPYTVWGKGMTSIDWKPSHVVLNSQITGFQL